jgi:hypothetical protein
MRKSKKSPSKAKNRPKRIRYNRLTERPRRWVCYDHNRIDEMLEFAEAAFDHRKSNVYAETMSKELLKSFIHHYGTLLKLFKNTLKARNRPVSQDVMSDAEIRYCRLEGIKLKDFLEQKLRRAIDDIEDNR